MNEKLKVSEKYLELRKKVLDYTNDDMNLKLENDEQVYIAVFDIPTESNVVYSQVQTFALLFGLNTHIYFGNGDAITGLEKNEGVMKAMQSLFISCPQVLNKMQLVENAEYYNSKNIRAYLKTKRGLFFKEIKGDCKEDRFLVMLINNIRGCISKLM